MTFKTRRFLMETTALYPLPNSGRPTVTAPPNPPPADLDDWTAYVEEPDA